MSKLSSQWGPKRELFVRYEGAVRERGRGQNNGRNDEQDGHPFHERHREHSDDQGQPDRSTNAGRIWLGLSELGIHVRSVSAAGKPCQSLPSTTKRLASLARSDLHVRRHATRTSRRREANSVRDRAVQRCGDDHGRSLAAFVKRSDVAHLQAPSDPRSVNREGG